MARPSQVRCRREGPLVSGDVDGDRAALPVAGGAAPAGEGRADGRAPAAGECWKCVSQGGFAGPGERCQVSDVRGLRLAGGGEVVAGGGPEGEPWREASSDGVGRQVAGGCGARQVGGDRLAAERGGAERERLPGIVLPRLRGRYGLPFPAGSAGGGDAVSAQLAGERRVAAGVAEGGDLAVQARAAQVGVVGGALADVGGERDEGVSMRAGLAGGPVPVEVDPDRLAVVAEVPGDLGHVLALPGQGDGLPGAGLGDHPGMWSPAEAMSTGMDSSVAFVMASVPSRTAWIAAARMRRSRLPIIPLLRECR